MILTAVGDGVGSSSWQTRGLIARRLSEIKNITKLPVTMFKNAWANPVQTCMHTYTHVHTGISHAREREGSSQQPASNREKKKHTTNLSKQLFIRVFNAKDKNKNKSCRIESHVVVRWRAPLCLELDPYSLRATSYDLLTRWHNISKVCAGYGKFGKWFALSFYLLHMNRSNVGKTER